MSSLAVSMDAFNGLCTKAEGRDKLARLFQYAARFIIGLTALGKLQAGNRLYQINELAGNVMKNLSTARRTHRWCKEFPVIKNIHQGLPAIIPQPFDAPTFVDRSLDMLQKVTLAFFLVIDHIGWLKQVKLLSGGRRAGTGTIQFGLKFFCASNALGAVLHLKRWRDAQVSNDEGKQWKCLETMMKHMFLVIQTAHLSRSYETHDVLVGLCGIVTSGMDLKGQWPAQSPAKADKVKEATSGTKPVPS
mmetsp:Transcript_75939/g.146756  ORF Transcript_75939/g.146756 Transcript_75939/m.146756 type:complete len:247 (-) Transcript_75939:66-806(-)